MDGFDEGLKKQYIVSAKAQYNLVLHKNPYEIVDLTNEGIQLTHDHFNPHNFQGEALLFDEPQLVHAQAIAHHRAEKIDTAINQLQQLRACLLRLPHDNRTKENLLTPVLLDLGQCLSEKGKLTDALELFEMGNTLSIKRNRGKYTPDFVFSKAKTLLQMGRKKECTELLTPVYFGYTSMCLPGKANEVLQLAGKLGYEINTYGADALPMQVPDLSVSFGETKPCNTFGQFLRSLCKIAGITEKALCEGLCDSSVLYKLVASDSIGITGNVYLLEAFMQRLGRHMDSYFDTFMCLKDFEQKELREEINSLLTHKRFTEAEALLTELSNMKAFNKHPINRQFIKSANATIYGRKQDKVDNKHMDMLLDAIRATKPRYDELTIAKTRLTYYEIVTVNQIACLTCQQGDLRRGTRIFENLLVNMDTNIVDEPERMRMYPTVLSNYTKFLGLMGVKNDALTLAGEGDEMCVKYGYLNNIPAFTITRAWNLCELGNDELGKTLLAQGHYASKLIGRNDNYAAAKKYAKERLGIDFV